MAANTNSKKKRQREEFEKVPMSDLFSQAAEAWETCDGNVNDIQIKLQSYNHTINHNIDIFDDNAEQDWELLIKCAKQNQPKCLKLMKEVDEDCANMSSNDDNDDNDDHDDDDVDNDDSNNGNNSKNENDDDAKESIEQKKKKKKTKVRSLWCAMTETSFTIRKMAAAEKTFTDDGYCNGLITASVQLKALCILSIPIIASWLGVEEHVLNLLIKTIKWILENPNADESKIPFFWTKICSPIDDASGAKEHFFQHEDASILITINDKLNEANYQQLDGDKAHETVMRHIQRVFGDFVTTAKLLSEIIKKRISTIDPHSYSEMISKCKNPNSLDNSLDAIEKCINFTNKCMLPILILKDLWLFTELFITEGIVEKFSQESVKKIATLFEHEYEKEIKAVVSKAIEFSLRF